MSESAESTQPTTLMPNRRNSPIRDAVVIGIFIALYVVLFFIYGMTVGATPLIMVLLPVIFGIFGGLILMVLLGRVQRTDVLLITGLIIGLIMISVAPGGVMYHMTITGGMVAEVIYWLMGRKSFASMTTAYTAFVTFFTLSEYIPFVWMEDAYLELYANNPTLDVAKMGVDMLNSITITMYCLFVIVACVAEYFRGRALACRQSFRAGIV